jgi:hypothetical protein
VVFPPELVIQGLAYDGYGLSSVEVSLDGGLTWQPAELVRDPAAAGLALTEDAVTWYNRVPLPDPGDGDLIIHSRAIDLAGNLEAVDMPVRVRVQADVRRVWLPLIFLYDYVSELDTVEVTVDNAAPVATLELAGSVLTGSEVRLTGTASDPFPAGGGIQRVEVQVDDGPWQVTAPPYETAPEGAVRWYLNWRLPPEEGVQHTLRARAVDVAGNVGAASEPTLVTVDSVSPASTIVEPKSGALLGDGQILVWGLASDGWGLAGVEVSLDGGRSWQPAQVGDEARSLLDSRGVSEVPPADELPAGSEVWAVEPAVPGYDMDIRSRASDLAGNVEGLRAPLRVFLLAQRIFVPLISR